MEVLVSSHGGTHSFPVALDACHHDGMLGGLLASVAEETGFGHGEFDLRAPATGTLLRSDSDLVALCDGDVVEAVQSDASAARQELAARGVPATPAALAACASGQYGAGTDRLRLLVRAGVRLPPDCSSLNAALNAGEGAEAVALLLEAGADPNTPGETWVRGRSLLPLETALYVRSAAAAANGAATDAVVAALMDGGARPTVTCAFLAIRRLRWDTLRAVVAVPHGIELARTGFVGLLRDASERGAPTAVVEELLAGGAPFAPGGMGAVCAAARRGNDGSLRLLLRAALGRPGGLPGSMDPTGSLRAAQRLAARGGSVACLELVREACAASGEVFEAGAVLAVAVRAGQADVVRHLVAQRGGGAAAAAADEEVQALLWAAGSTRTDLAHLLLDEGVRFDAAGSSVACAIVAAAAAARSEDLLRRLLAGGGGGYIVRRGEGATAGGGGPWRTALFAAVLRGRCGAVVYLLEAVGGGAAAAELVSVADPATGETCLHVAARRDCTAVLRLLIDAVRGDGNDSGTPARRLLDARSHAGDTALSVAPPAGSCAALLLAEGAAPSPAALPAAQYYARTGQARALLRLLELPPPPSGGGGGCSPSGRTFVDLSAATRLVPAVARAAREGDEATLRLLAARGFSLAAGIRPEGSPLCAAAAGARNEETVAALLELGADPNTGRGCALVCALRIEDAHLRYCIVERLLDAGACPNGAPYTPAVWRPFDLPVAVAAALPDGHDVLDLLLAHPRLDPSRTTPAPRGVQCRRRYAHPNRRGPSQRKVDAVQSLAGRGFVGFEQANTLMRHPSLAVTSTTLNGLAAFNFSHQAPDILLLAALSRVFRDAQAAAAAAVPPPPRPPTVAAAPPLSKRRLTRRGGHAAAVPPPPPPPPPPPVSEAGWVASVVCGRVGGSEERNALHTAAQSGRPEAARTLLDALEDAGVPLVPLRTPAAAAAAGRRRRRRRVRKAAAAAAATTLGVQFGHGHAALCAALRRSAPVVPDLLQKPKMGFWLDATLCAVAFGHVGGVPDGSPLLACTAAGDLRRVLGFAAMCLGWHGLLGEVRDDSFAGSLAACGLGAERVPREELPARFAAYVREAEKEGLLAHACRYAGVQELGMLVGMGVGLHAAAALHAAVSRRDEARPEIVAALLAAVRDEAASAAAAERGASSDEAEEAGRRAAAAYAGVREEDVSVAAALEASSHASRREEVLWRLLDAGPDLSEEDPVVLMKMCRRVWLYEGDSAYVPLTGQGGSTYDLDLVHEMLVRGARLSTTQHFCGEAERVIQSYKRGQRTGVRGEGQPE